MAVPYRSAEIRPESTPLALSWWSLAMSLLAAAFLGGLAYVLFRYVAGGWIGYAIAGLVALCALIVAREIGTGKLGSCPRCSAPIEVGVAREGYVCPGCQTFLEVDRGQLVASASNRVASRARFGVVCDGKLVLPDRCCVCEGATARREPLIVAGQHVAVPYCSEHSRGAIARPKTRQVQFRSLGYATKVCEASHGRLVGISAAARDERDGRWLGFGLGLLMAGGAAAVYFGLAALENSGYEIVPVGPKGLVVWIALKLLGRLWVTTALAVLAAGFFSMFIGSFKPRRRQ